MRRHLTDVSDAGLVMAIARYQQEALAEAYRRHGGAVFGLARRLLSDEARAEEIVQEVFLRLWNEPDRFDPDRGTLRSYLLSHCHGRAVDMIRSDVARRRREDRTAMQTVEDGYDVASEVWDLTLAAHVREAMGELTDDERAAIQLAYFGGKTYREVATELDEPEGTVKSRIRTGLRKLRTELVDAGVATGGDR